MIREFTESDIQHIISIWSDSFIESGYLTIDDFDFEGIERELRRALTNDLENVFILEEEGQVIGFLKCYIAKIPITVHLGVFEGGFFIRPGKRGAGGGSALIDAMNNWGKSHGVTGSMIQVISGVESNVDLLMAAEAYAPIGRNYIKWMKG